MDRLTFRGKQEASEESIRRKEVQGSMTNYDSSHIFWCYFGACWSILSWSKWEVDSCYICLQFLTWWKVWNFYIVVEQTDLWLIIYILNNWYPFLAWSGGVGDTMVPWQKVGVGTSQCSKFYLVTQQSFVILETAVREEWWLHELMISFL